VKELEEHELPGQQVPAQPVTFRTESELEFAAELSRKGQEEQREAAEREAAERESAEREREAAEREAAERDAAEREAAKCEAREQAAEVEVFQYSLREALAPQIHDWMQALGSDQVTRIHAAKEALAPHINDWIQTLGDTCISRTYNEGVRDNAAVTIQCRWRCYVARRIRDDLLEESSWLLKPWFQYSTTPDMRAIVEVTFMQNPRFDSRHNEASMYSPVPNTSDKRSEGTRKEIVHSASAVEMRKFSKKSGLGHAEPNSNMKISTEEAGPTSTKPANLGSKALPFPGCTRTDWGKTLPARMGSKGRAGSKHSSSSSANASKTSPVVAPSATHGTGAGSKHSVSSSASASRSSLIVASSATHSTDTATDEDAVIEKIRKSLMSGPGVQAGSRLKSLARPWSASALPPLGRGSDNLHTVGMEGAKKTSSKTKASCFYDGMRDNRGRSKAVDADDSASNHKDAKVGSEVARAAAIRQQIKANNFVAQRQQIKANNFAEQVKGPSISENADDVGIDVHSGASRESDEILALYEDTLEPGSIPHAMWPIPQTVSQANSRPASLLQRPLSHCRNRKSAGGKPGSIAIQLSEKIEAALCGDLPPHRPRSGSSGACIRPASRSHGRRSRAGSLTPLNGRRPCVQ
jgi:hypothetical protein